MVPLNDLGVSEGVFSGRDSAQVALSALPQRPESEGLKATDTYVSRVTWGILHQPSNMDPEWSSSCDAVAFF